MEDLCCQQPVQPSFPEELKVYAQVSLLLRTQVWSFESSSYSYPMHSCCEAALFPCSKIQSLNRRRKIHSPAQDLGKMGLYPMQVSDPWLEHDV